MQHQQLSRIAIITLLATLSTSFTHNLPVRFIASQVLAQTVEREAKADQLLQQAFGQLQTRQFEAALQSCQQALIIYQQIKDRKGESLALGILGSTYSSLDDYPQAIGYYQQFLTIAQEIKDRQGEAGVLGSLGIAYFSLGNYPKAIEFQQQRLAIAREMKDRQGEASALGELGIIYQSLGDYPKLIEYTQQALKIGREIKNREIEGAALSNLGVAYSRLRDYPKAIEYAQQHLAIAIEIDDPIGGGNAILTLGTAYFGLGDYPKAIEYFQKRVAIAQLVKDRKGESYGLGNLGVVYEELGDYPKAIEYYQQALKIAREIKDRQNEGSSLNNLGVAFYKQGNYILAESTLVEGINVLESLRGRLKDSEKVSIFETQSNTYGNLQKVRIAQNKTDAALEIAERGRARAFVELISSRVTSGNSEAKSLESPKITEIKQIAKTQNSTLVQYSIIYDDFKIAGKQQSKESELYIWVIKPTGEITFRKADLKSIWQKENTTLNDFVITSRNAIGVRGINVIPNANAPKVKNKLKQLNELLIKPIAGVLPTKETDRLIFVPQGSLFLVPFPALQDEDGKYLIEKHTILTSPSIQVLQLTHQQRNFTSGKDALVVGNPTMPKVPPKIGEPPQQLPPLPGAEKEAKAIAPLLKTQPLIGNKATKSAVLQLLPKARIIHFATHGLLDDIEGLNSAIALAPSGKDDGLLTADKILDLKLNAELVVLSACDTGRGRITGDGVIGLSRSLISAGVPSVMVSLWSIPDAPTASLMTEFYQNLQKNPDKAQALRQAMLTTMKQHPNPRDWAGFTLIGEAE